MSPSCPDNHSPNSPPPRETGRAGRAREEQVDLTWRIADLDRRIQRLSDYIDHVTVGDEQGEISVSAYTKLVSLYGQLCSRLGRLMRDQQQLHGGEESEIDQAMNDALDMASEILGIDI